MSSSHSSFRVAASKSKFEQELTEQEDKLTRVLSRIYREIRRDRNIQLSGGKLTFLEIKQLYQKQTEDAIHAAVAAT